MRKLRQDSLCNLPKGQASVLGGRQQHELKAEGELGSDLHGTGSQP